MKKDDDVFIGHILESIDSIEDFVKGITEKDLVSDRLRRSAIVREIEIIGEAAKNISNEFKTKQENIPWKEIIGARDKLIHHYFGVDLSIVWNIIKVFLPDLKKKLE
ncbi:MAG: DUF86 domain-containing protein, partial [Nanoarchaeota archaeon]